MKGKKGKGKIRERRLEERKKGKYITVEGGKEEEMEEDKR